MTKEDIAKTLLEVKAVDLDTETGFTYASGRKGPIYCDNRLLLSYPNEREKVIEEFLYLIKEKDLEFDYIAGVATGAIAWGAIIADRLKKPFIYIRAKAKDHGKTNQIEGELEQGKTVLVIEDLINTGGSSVAACEAVRQESCIVKACISIFSYGFSDANQKFTEAKIALYSLSDLNVLLKTASDIGYIDDKQKRKLMEWQKSPKEWEPC